MAHADFHTDAAIAGETTGLVKHRLAADPVVLTRAAGVEAAESKVPEGLPRGNLCLQSCPLCFIPADQLDSSSLIERPQLHFKACHPFAATTGKLAELPMTLLLISDDDRVADFAKAFGSLGIVKVPFVPTLQKN